MLAPRSLRTTLPAVLGLALMASVPTGAAWAQSIAATVNGDPITTVEIDEQMKFDRIVKLPSTREAALEDLVGDRIKLRQANKVGIDASETTLNEAFLGIANKADSTTATLLAAFQKAKLNTDLIRTHLRAVAAWTDYVKSRNKSISVSEDEVSAAMARNANLGKSDADYQLQQVVFVLPANATPAMAEAKMREAQALRNRFQSCAEGLPLARALPDVAIKPPINKKATTMPAATKKSLEQTGNGHLTSPERTGSGIEMIAICGVDENEDRTSIRDSVQTQLLNERLSRDGEKMYKDLRANAVIEKH